MIRAADASGSRGILVRPLSDEVTESHGRVGFDPSALDPAKPMVTFADLHAAL